ncbi:hypothetical protein ASF90_19150 [Xanthomonas sp. Leaf148]|nr:hypothetical protein ASF90_19150 [Xanthomonas sp. Leaf148]
MCVAYGTSLCALMTRVRCAAFDVWKLADVVPVMAWHGSVQQDGALTNRSAAERAQGRLCVTTSGQYLVARAHVA